MNANDKASVVFKISMDKKIQAGVYLYAIAALVGTAKVSKEVDLKQT
jgi:hypothetical protein